MRARPADYAKQTWHEHKLVKLRQGGQWQLVHISPEYENAFGLVPKTPVFNSCTMCFGGGGAISRVLTW